LFRGFRKNPNAFRSAGPGRAEASLKGSHRPAEPDYFRVVVVVEVVAVVGFAAAGAVLVALAEAWVDVDVITAGRTAPFELMFARRSVEKPDRRSAMRLLRLCSQL
jgi:hypothetical protein